MQQTKYYYNIIYICYFKICIFYPMKYNILIYIRYATLIIKTTRRQFKCNVTNSNITFKLYFYDVLFYPLAFHAMHCANIPWCWPIPTAQRCINPSPCSKCQGPRAWAHNSCLAHAHNSFFLLLSLSPFLRCVVRTKELQKYGFGRRI